MNLTLLVLLVATLFLGAAFADAVIALIHRLALAAGVVLLLRKSNSALLDLLKGSKLRWFREMPDRRALILYLAYTVALAGFWACAAYFTGGITLIVGFATYSALMTT
jgi:hypothetical protein